MSEDDLILRLQQLTLDEYRIEVSLREKREEIARVRDRLLRQQAGGDRELQINDRVRILNPTTFSKLPKDWNAKEAQATITGITYERHAPNIIKHYKVTTANGTKTWRAPKNVERLE